MQIILKMALNLPVAMLPNIAGPGAVLLNELCAAGILYLVLPFSWSSGFYFPPPLSDRRHTAPGTQGWPTVQLPVLPLTFVLLIMGLFPELAKVHETFHELEKNLAEKDVACARSSYDDVTNVSKWARPCFPVQF